MGFTHGATGGHTLGAAPQSRDSFFTDFLLRLAHLRRLRSPTHRDRSLGRTLERRRRGSGAQIRISPARARPLLWWCSAWVPVPVASFVSATAPQAQAPPPTSAAATTESSPGRRCAPLQGNRRRCRSRSTFCGASPPRLATARAAVTAKRRGGLAFVRRHATRQRARVGCRARRPRALAPRSRATRARSMTRP